jgi:hypothetical protein
MVKPAPPEKTEPHRLRHQGRQWRKTMQFQVRTSLAVLSFALFASAGFAQATPRLAADSDTLTIAQNESQEVEGEEGKSGQTPAIGGEEAGGGGAMTVPAPATESAPNSPANTMEEKGLQEEGR